MTLVWPPAVRGDHIENLAHKIINCHTYKFTNTCFFLNFRLCWTWWKTQTGENSAWHIHSCTLAKRGLCVWTSFFLFTSLVTHGQVTATPVCVTRIPWASSVSLFSVHQYRTPTAASPASSWLTRQKAAAQHRHVVSWNATELLVILSLCWWHKVTADGSKNLP